MSSPFRNYDSWLEAPFQAQCAAEEAALAAWEAFCDERSDVPVEACEDDHPDHAIFVGWLAMVTAIESRWDRLASEQMADEYAEQDRLQTLYDTLY